MLYTHEKRHAALSLSSNCIHIYIYIYIYIYMYIYYIIYLKFLYASTLLEWRSSALAKHAAVNIPKRKAAMSTCVNSAISCFTYARMSLAFSLAAFTPEVSTLFIFKFMLILNDAKNLISHVSSIKQYVSVVIILDIVYVRRSEIESRIIRSFFISNIMLI